MKSKLLLVFVLLCNFINAQNYQWANSAGTNHVESARSVAADDSGNVYVTGYFQGTSITFGTTVLTNTINNKTDMYLVKYDANGNVLWARSNVGMGYDQSSSVSTDAMGNVLVLGTFNSDSITFGAYTLMNVNPSGPFTLQDVFLVKYDGSGNVLWAKSGGSASGDIAHSVATDDAGNVVVAGVCSGDSLTFGSTTLSNLGGIPNMYIVKFDENGNVLWARNSGDYSEANSVAFDDSGNVVAFGYYTNSTIIFGTTTLTNIGFVNMFLVKYDVNGSVIWANNLGGSSADYSKALAVDTSGNIIVGGYFQSDTIIFGTDTLINASNNDDLFLAKYDLNGNVLWAKRAGGIGSDRVLSLAADISGNILALGTYNSPSIVFDSDSLVQSVNGYIYVVKYDANGNVIWLNGPGGTSGSDIAYSVAVDNLGDVLVTGDFWSATLTYGLTVLTNAGDYDMFIVKLSGLPTIVDNMENKNSISVFPNPSSGKFTLAAKGRLEIYNVLGEKILSQELISDKTEVDLGNYKKGIFVLKINSASTTYSRKIIVY